VRILSGKERDRAIDDALERQEARKAAEATVELPVRLDQIEGPLREGGLELADLNDDELRMLKVALEASIRNECRGMAIAMVALRTQGARGGRIER
jgi:hypothetical protein